MLVISADQVTQFETAARAQFEERLQAHVREYFPIPCRVSGDEAMNALVRAAILRARRSGYNSQRDAFMYASLMVYLGSEFPDDPQYPWLAESLADERVGRRRLASAFDAAIDYVRRAHGRNLEHAQAAYARSHELLAAGLPPETRVSADYALSVFNRLWPQKSAAVGPAALRELMARGVATAQRSGIRTTPGKFYFVLGAFLFGHALDRDPQLPWLPPLLGRVAAAGADPADELRASLALHLQKLSG